MHCEGWGRQRHTSQLTRAGIRSVQPEDPDPDHPVLHWCVLCAAGGRGGGPGSSACAHRAAARAPPHAAHQVQHPAGGGRQARRERRAAGARAHQAAGDGRGLAHQTAHRCGAARQQQHGAYTGACSGDAGCGTRPWISGPHGARAMAAGPRCGAKRTSAGRHAPGTGCRERCGSGWGRLSAAAGGGASLTYAGTCT